MGKKNYFLKMVSLAVVLSFILSDMVMADKSYTTLAAGNDTGVAARTLERVEAVVLPAVRMDKEQERSGGAVLRNKLTTPLSSGGDSDAAKRYLQGGYNQPGYGVPDGASIDGSHSVGQAGSQGYYVDGGRGIFLGIVQEMKRFFNNRQRRLGKPIRYIVKCGIGGQHTPFQGIADVFSVIDLKAGVITGEYELGKDYRKSIGDALQGLNAGWDQVVVIPSSKSGSTDETMMVFVEILSILLEKVADTKLGEGQGRVFADNVLRTLHEINFINGKERPGKDLFKINASEFGTASLIELAANHSGINRDTVREIFGIVLGNMFFETTDRPEESRLSAFIRNSGLYDELGDDRPGFGAMFDNVGGRWTADLHMITFLAFHDLDTEKYWGLRERGIKKVREGTHAGNILGNKILDGDITDIVLVVPDEFFWFGKSIEQNFNESIWQNGFANLIAVKKSKWSTQAGYYEGRGKLVINMSDLNIDAERYNLFKLDIPVLTGKTKQELADIFAEISTVFYGMTNTVGIRLIVRALHAAGYSVGDVDLNDLDNPATKIVQANLFVRQPYVELGKKLLEKQLGDLQTAEQKETGSIARKYETVIQSARRMELQAGVAGMSAEPVATNWDLLASAVRQAMEYARRTDRKFVPFIYLEGGRFYNLRDSLVDLGIEWVMQGTGDQHISYQQVLAQPQKYLPFIISFVPENLSPGLPAIGFAKGYLDNISTHIVRDAFAEASYKALTAGRKEQGGKGLFVRIIDTDENIAGLRDVFSSAVQFMPRGDNYEVATQRGSYLARAITPEAEEEEAFSFKVNDNFDLDIPETASDEARQYAGFISRSLDRLSHIYGQGILIRLKGREIRVVRNLNGSVLYPQGRAPLACYDGRVLKIDELLFTYPIAGIEAEKTARYRLYAVFDQVLHEGWESIGDIIPETPHQISDIVATSRNVKRFMNPNEGVTSDVYTVDEEEYKEAVLSMLKGENPIDPDKDYLELLDVIQKLAPEDRTDERVRKLVVRYAMKTKTYKAGREELGSLAGLEHNVAALDGLLDGVVRSFNRVLGVKADVESAFDSIKEVSDITISVQKTFTGFRVDGKDLSETAQRLIAVSADQIYKTERLAGMLARIETKKYLLAAEDRLRGLKEILGAEYDRMLRLFSDNNYIICTAVPEGVDQNDVVEMIDPSDLAGTQRVNGRHYLPPMPLSRSALYMAADIARGNGDAAGLDPMVKGFIRNLYSMILNEPVTDDILAELMRNPWWCLPKITNILTDLNVWGLAVYKLEQAA